MKIKSYQKVNHFPGMSCITRKNLLGFYLTKFSQMFPEEYDYFPFTWLIPNDLVSFEKQFTNGISSRLIICKPEASCQGRGIIITKKLKKIDLKTKQVAQIYIDQPLLLNGHKVIGT